MKFATSCAVTLLVPICLSAFAGVSLAAKAPGVSVQRLQETIERYFHSIECYQQGDLICQSQVDEIQQYLRRTQGHIPATHPRLMRRALPDEAPLVRFFFAEGGAAILRQASARLGGYGRLQTLSLTVEGRSEISAAISSKDPELLAKFASEDSSPPNSSPSAEQAEGQVLPVDSHIYTLQQFIEASLMEETTAGKAPD